MGRTQKELADTLSHRLGIPVRVGRAFLHGLLDLVAEDLAGTGRVELRGLGTFAVQVRPARETVHPVTRQPVHIPARRSVRYRTSRELKARLNSEG